MMVQTYLKKLYQCLLCYKKLHIHKDSPSIISSWDILARPEQRIPPGDWKIWLIMAGRGFGKTRTGAETVRQWAALGPVRIGLVAATLEDGRKTMIEGVSGLLALCTPPPRYLSSRGEIYWPNGAQATLFSAEKPDQLRGPQFHYIWTDEMAKFRHMETLWDQMMITLRLGHHPRMIITTTPRPHPLWNRLLQDESVYTTRGSTRDNSGHLSPEYMKTLEKLYEHTPWALQELEGHLLQNTETLWTSHLIEQAQCLNPPPFKRSAYKFLVIALDPAVSISEHSSETGLIVIGKTKEGMLHVLNDKSGKMTSLCWAQQAVALYHHYQASYIVAETNHGGDLVQSLIHQLSPQVRFMAVKASQSKWTRAEPVIALYAQGRVLHHGLLSRLEQQLLHPQGKEGLDRMDALVWGIFALEKLSQAPHNSIRLGKYT